MAYLWTRHFRVMGANVASGVVSPKQRRAGANRANGAAAHYASRGKGIRWRVPRVVVCLWRDLLAHIRGRVGSKVKHWSNYAFERTVTHKVLHRRAGRAAFQGLMRQLPAAQRER